MSGHCEKWSVHRKGRFTDFQPQSSSLANHDQAWQRDVAATLFRKIWGLKHRPRGASPLSSSNCPLRSCKFVITKVAKPNLIPCCTIIFLHNASCRPYAWPAWPFQCGQVYVHDASGRRSLKGVDANIGNSVKMGAMMGGSMSSTAS